MLQSAWGSLCMGILTRRFESGSITNQSSWLADSRVQRLTKVNVIDLVPPSTIINQVNSLQIVLIRVIRPSSVTKSVCACLWTLFVVNIYRWLLCVLLNSCVSMISCVFGELPRSLPQISCIHPFMKHLRLPSIWIEIFIWDLYLGHRGMESLPFHASLSHLHISESSETLMRSPIGLSLPMYPTKL